MFFLSSIMLLWLIYVAQTAQSEQKYEFAADADISMMQF